MIFFLEKITEQNHEKTGTTYMTRRIVKQDKPKWRLFSDFKFGSKYLAQYWPLQLWNQIWLFHGDSSEEKKKKSNLKC